LSRRLSRRLVDDGRQRYVDFHPGFFTRRSISADCDGEGKIFIRRVLRLGDGDTGRNRRF